MRFALKLIGVGVFAILLLLGVSVAWRGLYIYIPQSDQDAMRLIRINRITGSTYVLPGNLAQGWRRVENQQAGTAFDDFKPQPLPPDAVIH